MDFIHCYSCYVQLKPETEHLFYVSSCGKLFCTVKCIEKAKSKKCESCPKCEVILLTQAPPQIQEFFSDIETLLEDMKKKSVKVIDYQNGLRDRLFKCVHKKYNNLKIEYVKLSEQYKTLYKDYKRLQDHIKRDAIARQSHASIINSSGGANQIMFGKQPQTVQAIFGNQSYSSIPINVGSGSMRYNPLNVSKLSSIAATPSNMSVDSFGGSTIRGNNSGGGSTIRGNHSLNGALNMSSHFLTLSQLSLNKYNRK